MKLYERPGLWTWLNLILPGVAVIISLTGMTLGTYQLFPRRHRGSWRVSAYHGVSLWHHVAGIVFGALVFTWTLSGVFEMLGAGNDARAGQAEAVRGGRLDMEGFVLGPEAALARVAPGEGHEPPRVRFLEAGQVLGRPGYHVVLADHTERWVDAADGSVREELAPRVVRAAAEAAVPGLEIVDVSRLDAYDYYYYHRHGREMHLPVWRVRLAGEGEPALYLHTVTATPTGYVDADTRLWRWLRDGMHSLDFPALVRRRPLWDLVLLPLMLGGTLSCMTGAWLLIRRLDRVRERRRR